MSEYKRIAEDVQGLAKKFKVLLELGAALEKIGNIENSTKEAEFLKEKAYASMAKAKLELVDLEKVLEAKKDEIKSSELKAEKIIEAAHVKGNGIVDGAVAESKLLLMDVEKKKKLFDEQFVAAGKELADVQSDIVLKKQELEAIKKEAEAIKSKFSALLK